MYVIVENLRKDLSVEEQMEILVAELQRYVPVNAAGMDARADAIVLDFPDSIHEESFLTTLVNICAGMKYSFEVLSMGLEIGLRYVQGRLN